MHVAIICPTLGRPEKLARLLRTIPETAEYNDYEVVVKQDVFGPDNKGVPWLLAEAVAEHPEADAYFYIGNDCIPQPGWLRIAVECMLKYFPDLDGLVSVSDLHWHGELAVHFLAGRNLLPLLDGELFHTGYFHTYVDSELAARTKQMNKYVWCEEAKIVHDHPVGTGMNVAEVDDVLALAYRADRVAHDQALLRERAAKLGFPVLENFRYPVIPRNLFTFWLGDAPVPAIAEKCIASQKKFSLGWNHQFIRTPPEGIPYVDQAMAVGRFVKAVDYLRLFYLYKYGGIYLDSDVELLKPLPDDIRTDRLFAGLERNGWINNGVVGAEPGHPVLKQCMEAMEAKARGDDNSVDPFDIGVKVFTETIYGMGPAEQGVRLYEPEVFTPYDHQGKTVNITDKTLAFHHFMVSWGYPRVHPCMRLDSRLGDLMGKKVLNIGLGPGTSGMAIQVRALPFEKLDNIEIYQPYIDEARKRFWVAKRVHFYHADARWYEVADYDLVLALDVIEHLPKKDALRLISKCQHMVVFIPLEETPRTDWEGVEDNPSLKHLATWTEAEFKELGFQTEVIREFHHESTGNVDALWAIK